MNEDALFCSDKQVGPLPNLYIVADGMGGHNAGDIASANCVKYLVTYFQDIAKGQDVGRLFEEALAYANDKIFKESNEQVSMRGMGTTVVVCSVYPERIYIANIGDSRLYTYGQVLSQITVDHSFVEELYRAGQITEVEMRHHPDKNMITRALGVEGSVESDFFDISRQGISHVLLCTDGLTKLATDREIEGILKKEISIEATVNYLTQRALDNGGKDNITVILTELESEVAQ